MASSKQDSLFASEDRRTIQEGDHYIYKPAIALSLACGFVL